MIVNNERKFAFSHIPKCGGTSITNYLLSILGTKLETPEPGYVHGALAHMPQYHDYFNFATIRGPLEWYVSLYNHCKRHYHIQGPQECFIFGDVITTPFLEWVYNATHFKEAIGKSDVWNSEIGYTEKKEDLINCKLCVGWYTIKVLYGLSHNYKEQFDMNIYDLLHDDSPLVDVDCLVTLDTIEKNIPIILKSMCSLESEHLDGIKFGIDRKGTHEKSMMKNYTPEAVFHVLDKDQLIYDICKKSEAVGSGVFWYDR